MKKCFLLLLLGVAFLSCKNELREEFIREYYEVKLYADTIQMQIDECKAKHDSLDLIKDNSPETMHEFLLCNQELASLIEHHANTLEIAASYMKDAADLKKIFDRDYWGAYKKELQKQGRL